MSATIITTGHILDRVGGNNERKRDRKHVVAMLTWQFNRNWREAEEANDVERMAFLARNKEQWDCL